MSSLDGSNTGFNGCSRLYQHRPEVHPDETEGEEERAACPQLLPLGVIFYFFADIERYRQGMV